MRRLAIIAGARPNFMKIAPIMNALKAYADIELTLVHTGQHYDHNLSDVFFEELGIRRPDVSLGIGSGTHAKQTSDVMIAVESILMEAESKEKPFSAVLVVGDVNSTMAAAIAATKVHVPVVHVEAGLRSGDRTMPEEINRLVTDSISELLFCSEPAGVENLMKEGHPHDSIVLVGNVMIDTLMSQVERAQDRDILERMNLEPNTYGFVTLHRPSNVDNVDNLRSLLEVLSSVSNTMPIVFPVHPRTRSRIDQHQLWSILNNSKNCFVLEPLGYLDCLCLTSQAKVIVTDSGGLQEESTALGVPCLTMRENTERPITCSEGTGTLIGSSSDMLAGLLADVTAGRYKTGKRPDLWDGKAAVRIAGVLDHWLN